MSVAVKPGTFPTQLRREIEHLTMRKGCVGVTELLSWRESTFDVQLAFPLYREDLLMHVRRGGFHGQRYALANTCMQMLTGLSHMHDLNILHRDIKPANIMLSAIGDAGQFRALISDLGSSVRMIQD